MLYLRDDLRDNLGLCFLCSGSVLSKRNVMQGVGVLLNLRLNVDPGGLTP